MLTYQTKIKLHETDAAGVLFFSNQFKLIHDAYETLLESIGFGFEKLTQEKNFFLPIVHCEADYKSPLRVGNLIEIQTVVAKVGTSSFTLSYKLLNVSQQLVGTALTVHVAVDKHSRSKIPLSEDFREEIENLLE